MFNRFRKKREITDLEKTEIIVEYLKDKLEMYKDLNTDPNIGKLEPTKLIEIILNYEERKLFFMTNLDALSYIQRGISKEES